MTTVVVDASVLIACLLRDGATRKAFLTTPASLVAPEFLVVEVGYRIPRIAHGLQVEPAALRALFAQVMGRVTILAGPFYDAWQDLAARLAREAGASGDEEYVALSLALDAPIWTFDRDFERIRAVRVVRL